MNGEQARALRKMKAETLLEMQPSMEHVAGYARSVESKLIAVAARHDVELKDLRKRADGAGDAYSALIGRSFWGRMRWLLTGK